MATQQSVPTPAPVPAPNETKQSQSGTKPPVIETKVPVDATKPAQDETNPEAKKSVNPLEQELAAAFGEDWDKMPQKAKERVIAAEMKSREADKRMQLAAKLKKDLDMTNGQVNQLIEALRKDPWKVLSNPALGHDVRKLAEEYVWQMIQEQRMTPEQREAVLAKAELAEMKARQEEAKERQERHEMETLTAQRRAYWEKTIAETMEAEKLPKISYVVRRFTDYIKAASKQRTPADLPKIASVIREELVALQQQYLMPPRFNGESDEQFEERILTSAPNEFVKMIRKADIRRLRAKGAMPKPGPKPGSAPASNQGPKKMSMSEWLNQRDQRLGRK